MIFVQILEFMLVLSFLVIIHELGHFLVAKLFHVHVEEFGVGYPPRALKLFTWLGTVFTLNWVPFGGFVKLEGEEGEEIEAETKTGKPGNNSVGVPFYKKSIPARLAIILAGATVNFLFGVLAFSVYFSVKGIPELVSDDVHPRVEQVFQHTPAEQAGIAANVDIVGFVINGVLAKTPTTDQVKTIVSDHLGQTVTIVTTGECNGLDCKMPEQQHQIYLRTKAETPAGEGSIGIQFGPVVKLQFYPWYQMPFRGGWIGIQQSVHLSVFIVQSLGDIIVQAFHGQVPKEVSGPVGIFRQAQHAGFLSQGLIELIYFAALLSVNLAIMNVLPIPALDGGRALFLILEKIIGKKTVHKFEGYANTIGFSLLIGLVLLVTARDIWGIFQK